MAVVKCDVQQGLDLAARHGLSLAGVNAPEQVVLSGDAECIRRLLASARARRVRAKELPARAYHSIAMTLAREPFEESLRDRVLADALAGLLRGVRGVIRWPRSGAARSLTELVRWLEVVQRFAGRGVERFLDVGPGSVLAGLVGTILRGAQVVRSPTLRLTALTPGLKVFGPASGAGIRTVASPRSRTSWSWRARSPCRVCERAFPCAASRSRPGPGLATP